MAYSPYVDPVTPIPTSTAPPQGQVPSAAAIAMLREYSKALQNQKSQLPTYTKGAIGMGLADFTRALTSGWAAKTADEEEAERNRVNSEIDAKKGLGGNAAPGGAASANPFIQDKAGLDQTSEQSQPSQTSRPTRMAALETGVASNGPSYPRIPYTTREELDPEFVESQKKLEGFSGKSYPDYKQHSVGYGSKAKFPGELLNRDQADSRLQDDLWKASKIVDDLDVPMTKGQREALISLTNNTGSKWVNSGLGQAVRAGDWGTATQLIQQYNHAGGQVNPGLVSRRAAEAHAMSGGPDVGLTSDLVDYYRTKNAAGTALAQAAPPTQLAQNTSQRLAPGALQSDVADYIRERGGRGNTPFDPNDILRYRLGTMPQYSGPNEFGMGLKTAPGEVPQPYFVPGMPGKIGTVGKSGIIPQQQILVPGAPGQPPQLKTIIIPPEVAPLGPTSQVPSAPPPAAPPPVGATVQVPIPSAAPPTGAPARVPGAPPAPGTPATPAIPAPGIMTTQAPPSEDLPYRLASNVIMGPGSQRPVTAQQEAQTTDTAAKAIGAEDWPAYLKWANSMARIPSAYQAPDIMDLFNKARSPDPAVRNKAINDLAGLDKLEEAEAASAKEKDTKAAAENAELSKAISEGGTQAIKLQQGLKLGLRTLNNPAFESGPGAALMTGGRNIATEAKRWLSNQKDENGNPRYPGVEKFIDKLDWKSPVANQVFAKIIAGSVLQSLRQMLGPNAGQFRVQELKLLEQAYGNENLSLEGNKVVMSLIDKLNDRAILTNRMANEYRKTHGGTIDANFNSMLDQFAEDHPAFRPEDYDKLENIASTGSPNPPKEPGGPIETPPPASPGGFGGTTPEDIQRERERRKAR